MNATYQHLAPWCPLPLTNQARGYTKADDTDIRRTFAEHQIGDDYDRVQREDWLEPGGFR